LTVLGCSSNRGIHDATGGLLRRKRSIALNHVFNHINSPIDHLKAEQIVAKIR